jgi:hypothetical protein
MLRDLGQPAWATKRNISQGLHRHRFDDAAAIVGVIEQYPYGR